MDAVCRVESGNPDRNESVTDEEYVLSRANNSCNQYESMAWLLTAETLFPENVSVQLESFKFEKNARHAKEAAKCLARLFQNFPYEPNLWEEVSATAEALRSNSDDATAVFLREMFSHIPAEIQQQLLLVIAEKSEDTMENCRLLLLLMKMFPQTVTSQGPKLVDTLLAAEKHSHYQNAVNCYRKLLVCDLLPMLGASDVDVPLKHTLRLLHKSYEFYVAYLLGSRGLVEGLTEAEARIEDVWARLYRLYEAVGLKLGWQLGTGFAANMLTKESLWHSISHFHQTHSDPAAEPSCSRQVVYAAMLLFLRSLHDYTSFVAPGVKGDKAGKGTVLVLVESLPLTATSSDEPAKKIRKMEEMLFSCSDPPSYASVTRDFTTVAKCWELVHSNDATKKEFTKLQQHLKLAPWLESCGFLSDVALYKGEYKECLKSLVPHEQNIKKLLQRACVLFAWKQYPAMYECILQVTAMLSHVPTIDTISELLRVPSTSDCLKQVHFLPITRGNVLHYCVGLMIHSLKAGMVDLSLGHLLVLLQLGWPQERPLYREIVKRIQENGTFSYPLFTRYIINVYMLEDFAYLSSLNGGSVNLNILVTPTNPLLNQRRISTRGADRGVKEDLRLALRRQVARFKEPLEPLIINFITAETDLLLNSFQLL